MLRKSLKFTYRLIKKDKFHYFLNVLGISTGIACAIVIFLYLQHELGYDRHHAKSDRIYRVSSTYVTSGEPIRFNATSPALGPRLSEEFPEIEAFARIAWTREIFFKYQDTVFYEDQIFYADPSVTDIFSYEFIHGDASTCLDEPYYLVLTEKLAHKYFGDANPVGQIVKVENQYDLKVTAVIKDLPQNSHQEIDGFISFATWNRNDRALKWVMFEIFGSTYVLLPKDYDFQNFWDRWPAFYEKYCAETGKKYGQTFIPIFQKLPDIRYGKHPIRGDTPKGSRAYLIAFFAIGLFILILASINYINISTARATTRAKEISVKKVLGSSRKKLIFQILGESLFIAFLALLAAYLLVFAFIQLFPVEQLLEFQVQLNPLNNLPLLAGSLLIFLVIGLSSGLYPALYMSSILPVKALRGSFKSGRKGLLIRKVLVTAQFVISIAVVVITLFMIKQIEFMREKDLGFQNENTLIIPFRDQEAYKRTKAAIQEIKNHEGILSATIGFSRPGDPSTGLHQIEGNEGMEEHNYYVFFVDYDYIDTVGFELAAGRDFDPLHTSDPENAVLVNETLVKTMKWDEPIGKIINQFQFKGKVVGVVKDFNFRSLHNVIEPLIIRMQRFPAGSLILKVDAQSIKSAIKFMEDKWMVLSPNRPFEYTFLDDELARLYDADVRQSRLLKLFSTICILISCLGLLGLSSFNAIRRTKEIAIRKVHGATAVNIILILFREIFVLIVIASLLVIPGTVYLVHLWLGNFAYRIDLDAIVYAVAILGALVIAFSTAAYHCFKVAYSNPVKSLRYE